MDQGILGHRDFLFLQGDLVALLFLEGLFLLVFLVGLLGQVNLGFLYHPSDLLLQQYHVGQVSQQVQAVPCVLEHPSLQVVPIIQLQFFDEY